MRHPLPQCDLGVLVELNTASIRILCSRKHNMTGDEVSRIKTQIGLVKFNKTSNKQSGADEEHQGKRNLRDDQRAAKDVPARHPYGLTSRLFQSTIQIDSA